MKPKWRFAAFLMTLTLAVPMPTFAATSQYSDIKGHWAKEYVTDASGLEIFHGYEDGQFHPDDQITRAEFVTALVQALGLQVKSDKGNLDFADVKTDDWFYAAVQTGIRAGLIQDQDYTSDFMPNQPISRGEMARMIARAVAPYANVPDVKKSFTDVDSSSPFAFYINQAAGYGILGGYEDGSFKPNQGATRAEAAVMVLRALKVIPQQGPYHIQLQGIENPAGPSFAINQLMAGMRDIYNYENSTDFTPLKQFADSKVVEQLKAMFQQFGDQNKGMMLVPDGSPLLPKLISRTTAVVEQKEVTFFKRSPQGKAFSGEYAVAENVTWYLKFEDGKWKVTGVQNFQVPDLWQQVKDEQEIPPHIDYKFESKIGTFYGKITLSPGAEPYVSDHIKELFEGAGSDKMTIYAIGEHPAATTQWASQVKEWGSNPPKADHTGKIRFVTYQNSDGELGLIWVSKEQIAVGFYVPFTNLNEVQIISVDEVPWTKLWNDTIWFELIKNETYDTIFDNAPKYQKQIEEILQKAK